MQKQNRITIFLPVMFSFFVMGMVDLVGVATGYVKQDFGLPDRIAQLIPFTVFIWFAILSIPTGVFQDRHGKKKTVNIGMILTGIGLLIPMVWYSLPTALAGFALLGIGNTILQVSANPLLIDISPAGSRAANLSLSQLVKAVASMLGPMVTAGLALYAGNWKWTFPVFALIALLSAWWLATVRIEESKPEKAPATIRSALTLFRNPYILITILSIFFMVGFDVAMNTNIASYLTSRFSISLESASMGIVIYFASLMVGRFVGALLLRRINIRFFMVISALITLAGLIGILFSDDLLMTRILIFVTGLGFSNTFPIMFALIVEQKPDYANELSGLIILAVSGGALIPPLVGLLTDFVGVSAVIFVLTGCILYITYAAWYVIKH